jgi:hypothetical protein
MKCDCGKEITVVKGMCNGCAAMLERHSLLKPPDAGLVRCEAWEKCPHYLTTCAHMKPHEHSGLCDTPETSKCPHYCIPIPRTDSPDGCRVSQPDLGSMSVDGSVERPITPQDLLPQATTASTAVPMDPGGIPAEDLLFDEHGAWTFAEEKSLLRIADRIIKAAVEVVWRDLPARVGSLLLINDLQQRIVDIEQAMIRAREDA